MHWITPFPLSAADRPHTRAIHLALVRDLYGRGRVPALAYLGALAILASLLGTHLASGLALRSMFGGLVVVNLARAVLSFQGERLEAAYRRPLPRFALFTALACATGLLLGGIVLAASPVLAGGPFMLLIFWCMGVAAVGCITMGGSPLCYAASMLPNLGSLVLVGFLRPPFGMGAGFPLAVLAYMVALGATAIQVHHSLFSAVLLNQRLEDLALRDPLTGLRNRRYLQEFMQEETPRVLRRWLQNDEKIRNRRSISLILVDLDLFKRVNDEFGHVAGDAVLRQVAQLLRQIVRKPDLVLRWGGEEFLILALDSDRATPPQLAVRVHQEMAAHRFTLPGGQELRQTCSVGYAIYPFLPERPEGISWEQVFRMADQCLYDAKEQGRNRLCGFLPGDADPEAVVAALEHPDPDFSKALADGLIKQG
jgi:diguanylate cyclase (GGDEF)-like protein